MGKKHRHRQQKITTSNNNKSSIDSKVPTSTSTTVR